MTRPSAKTWIALLIGTVCLFLVTRLFDWSAVAVALAGMRLPFFLLSVPIFLLVLLLRGLRWLQVLELRPTRDRIFRSFLVNAVSAGFASFTPLQLGELVKLRGMEVDDGGMMPRTAPAFVIERILDISGLVGVGLAGWAAYCDVYLAVLPALLLPLLAAVGLSYGTRWLGRPLPQRWRAFLQAMHRPADTFRAATTTIPIWLLNAVGWWVAAHAIGVSTSFAHSMLLLGGSTLAAIGSMVPAGLGASELSTRGILILLGFDRVQAESVAIAVRLLTLVLMAIGAVCALAFAALRHRK